MNEIIREIKCDVYIGSDRLITVAFMIVVMGVLLPYSPFSGEPYYPDLSLPWVPFHVKLLAITMQIFTALTFLGIAIWGMIGTFMQDTINSMFRFIISIYLLAGIILFIGFNRAGLTPFFPIPI